MLLVTIRATSQRPLFAGDLPEAIPKSLDDGFRDGEGPDSFPNFARIIGRALSAAPFYHSLHVPEENAAEVTAPLKISINANSPRGYFR